MFRENRPLILIPQEKRSTVRAFEEVAASKGFSTVVRKPIAASINPGPSYDTYVIWVRDNKDKNPFSLAKRAVSTGARVGIVTLSDVRSTSEKSREIGALHCSLDEMEFASVMSWLKDKEAIRQWLESRLSLQDFNLRLRSMTA